MSLFPYGNVSECMSMIKLQHFKSDKLSNFFLCSEFCHYLFQEVLLFSCCTLQFKIFVSNILLKNKMKHVMETDFQRFIGNYFFQLKATMEDGGKFFDLPGAVKGKVVVRFPPEASGSV